MVPETLLQRIEAALDAASKVFAKFDRDSIAELTKSGGDPVTAADYELDEALKQSLHREPEGWLSEETADDPARLEAELVWIVDPLDGTREFIDGLPEYCASVAAVVDGRPVAGGILNPAADLRITGAVGLGVTVNARPSIQPQNQAVLASRSEWKRGQWQSVEASGMEVIPMGSVAYKLARVAAGLDAATWTPVPKHEWDVAGGAALLEAIGGSVLGLDGAPLRFNQPKPWLSGAIAAPPWFDAHRDRTFDLIRLQLAD